MVETVLAIIVLVGVARAIKAASDTYQYHTKDDEE